MHIKCWPSSTVTFQDMDGHRKLGDFGSGSTIRTLSNVGFLLFFRVVQVIMANPVDDSCLNSNFV